ncbi:MAG: hypothetical protein HY919_01150 [Elusimicrobia bacterium]|nr:hypothetical protein [Elusimicrobiota bacterium]
MKKYIKGSLKNTKDYFEKMAGVLKIKGKNFTQTLLKEREKDRELEEKKLSKFKKRNKNSYKF